MKSLAGLHGAAFAIASTPGAGTTVTIVFPMTRVLRRRAASDYEECVLSPAAAD